MLSWREEFNEMSQLEGPLQASQVGMCRHAAQPHRPHMNTPRISDKLAFPSFMADIFSLVLNSENETLASGCFSWLSMMKCECTTHPPPVLVFWCSFSVPSEMHTEQLSIDGGLN